MPATTSFFEPAQLGPVTARNRFFQVPHCNGMGYARPTVRAICDAFAPGTIAAAVWDGHRYAEELDDPAVANNAQAPFKREVVTLADE